MKPEEQRKIYPKFIADEMEKLRLDPIVNNPIHPTKITDFLPMITCIWKISSKDYQERFWVRQEAPMRGDNFMETTMTFIGDVEGVLDTSDYTVEMTDKQREALKTLYDMVEAFEDDPETPEDPGYGENDEAIVNDPKWDKIRQYAKRVYEILTDEKLPT